MIIEKKHLKLIFKEVLIFINEKVEINEDNYLIIGSDVWTDFSNDKIIPVVGSLDDDFYFLKQIIEEKRAISSSDLDRFSSILRAISQEINPIWVFIYIIEGLKTPIILGNIKIITLQNEDRK